MEDLNELRKEIDTIDKAMVDLFEKRMDVSRRVAEYKIANGKKVLDREREQQKLESLGALAHNSFNCHGVQELFQQIMAMSRKLQYLEAFHLPELIRLTENIAAWCIRDWRALISMRQPCSILEKM